MKRIVYILILLACAIVAKAQKLTVESFVLASNDITASSQLRTDNNGDPCALIKVRLAASGASFEGNIVGNTAYSQGEYRVYMTDGSKQLEVRHDNYLPLDISFSDYGVNSVKGKMTYVLTLVLPQANVNAPVDVGGNFVALSVMPQNAIVSIDGNKPLATDPTGQYMQMLSYGQHTYEVSCSGYLPKSDTFTIGKGNATELNVSLESALATLTVNCPTEGATLYVDKKSVGKSPWTGTLQDGMHLIEAMKEGYRDVQKSVTLSEQQKLTVSLDALTPIQGNLSVSYRPIGADIYLDGKKSATTPYVFNGLLVGSHTIEIRKNGYASETKTVTVSEGQTASLQGSLKEIASATTAQTANQNSSSLSGNGQTFTVNGVSFTMIPVEGGTFIMGETATGWNAYHSVTLSNYMIGETEVTQAFWRAVMGKNPSKYKGNNRPVERVNWNDCQKFIDKLNSLTGKRFRLPTEAEWEYASKGGNNGCGNWYSGSNTIGEVAWYFGNSDGSGTHDVKTKSPNELGIYDMSGNVMEWCSDWYSSYSSSSQSNPTGVDSGTYRVCRGGGFLSSDDYCSSSKRQFILPDSRIFYHGLRLALSE